MTAECLGLEYNFKLVDLMAGDHMKPEFLALNPMHNIPTMVDGDFVMNESRAIAAYLVNKYGKNDQLYPKDAEVRARVDQKLYFDMGVFYKAFGDCVYPIMFGGPMPGQDKFDKLKEVLGWAEGFVADNKFAAGTDNLTIGDLALIATYSTIKAASVGDLENYPNLAAWFEKCCKLIPNYQKVNEEGAEAFGTWYKTAGKR
eukprot:TRINITY_DN7402_c0_g1_i2.p1 TRINITY_DN7402_c0_g1~~TRINITY_DN7402_c0_g1_i2.p1  ORF type:complete len:222 (+),score=50.80 TRINITY_DN7402_c0_g1_i2:64-666(+)